MAGQAAWVCFRSQRRIEERKRRVVLVFIKSGLARKTAGFGKTGAKK
jgi:hypothetical protein